jgi:hypothetical protein
VSVSVSMCCPTVRRTIWQRRSICRSMYSSNPGRRSSRGRMRRVGAHRSIGRAVPIRSVAGRARYRPRGDETARGSGPGADAVPRRPGPWGAAAAVERAQRPCVDLGKTRPTGGE